MKTTKAVSVVHLDSPTDPLPKLRFHMTFNGIFGVSINGGIQNGWFMLRKIPSINGWWLGVHPYFRKPPFHPMSSHIIPCYSHFFHVFPYFKALACTARLFETGQSNIRHSGIVAIQDLSDVALQLASEWSKRHPKVVDTGRCSGIATYTNYVQEDVVESNCKFTNVIQLRRDSTTSSYILVRGKNVF